MEREDLVALGALLRRQREEHGLTQEELAESAGAGLSVDTISNIERGRTRPYRQTLEALMDALEVDEGGREAIYQAWRRARRTGESAARTASSSGSSPDHPSLQTDVLALTVRRAVDVPSRPPLVGREAERDQLARHLADHGPPVLLLGGEPGIGKSRLLEDVVERGRAAGYAVLTGGCQRRSGEEPFSPLVEMLAQSVHSLPTDERQASLQGCGWLTRLLPELLELVDPPLPPGTIPPEQERRLVFAAVRTFLHNLVGAACVLLVLDDLQWVGRDALDLLSALIGPPSGTNQHTFPLRVVGAYRDTEVGVDSALAVALADWAHAGLVRQISLGPLSGDEADTLLQSALPGVDDTDGLRLLRHHIVQRTGGVPFFLMSCVQSMREGTLQNPRPEFLPWDLAQALRQRVAGLPSEVQEVLSAAAVIGRVVPYRLLGAVTGLPEPELLAALDAALRARLLEEEGSEDFRFAHDIVWEVIEADLGRARRMVLHRRIGEALEAQESEPSVESLAYHYARSGEQEKAIHYLESAGDAARAAYAPALAAEHYRELLARRDRQGWPAETAEVRIKLGDVLTWAGQYEEALAELEAAIEAYRAGGDRESEARAVALIGQVYFRQDRADEGIRRLRALAEDLARSDSSLSVVESLIPLWHALAALYITSGQPAESLKAAEQMACLAGITGEARVAAEAEVARGIALFWMGACTDAVSVLERGVRLTEQMGLPSTTGAGLHFLAMAHTVRGEFDRGRACSERALAAQEQISDRGWIGWASSQLGLNLFCQGEWTRARRYLERGVEMARAAGPSPLAFWPLGNLAELCIATGAWEEARTYLEEAADIVQRLRRTPQPYLQACMARIDVLEGRPEAALSRLEPLLDVADDVWVHRPMLRVVLALAYLKLGEIHKAEFIVEPAVPWTTETQHRVGLVDVLCVKGMILANQRRCEEAMRMFDETLTLARSMGYPYAEAHLLVESGAFLLDVKGPPPARERLEEGLSIFRRLGAHADVSRIERELAHLARV